MAVTQVRVRPLRKRFLELEFINYVYIIPNFHLQRKEASRGSHTNKTHTIHTFSCLPTESGMTSGN